MQARPVDAALLPFLFYSKLCWAMIKGCQCFNLIPWQLEGVICMFAWQCDCVISRDNASNIHSGAAVPRSIKCNGGRGGGVTSVAAGIMSRKLSYFFLLEGQETYRCVWSILLIQYIKYWTQGQLPGTPSEKLLKLFFFPWFLYPHSGVR